MTLPVTSASSSRRHFELRHNFSPRFFKTCTPATYKTTRYSLSGWIKAHVAHAKTLRNLKSCPILSLRKEGRGVQALSWKIQCNLGKTEERPGRGRAVMLLRGKKLNAPCLLALAKGLVQWICKRSHTFIKNVLVSSLLTASVEDEP